MTPFACRMPRSFSTVSSTVCLLAMRTIPLSDVDAIETSDFQCDRRLSSVLTADERFFNCATAVRQERDEGQNLAVIGLRMTARNLQRKVGAAQNTIK